MADKTTISETQSSSGFRSPKPYITEEQRLEKKKLLQRKPHETDRRSFLIELTKTGEAYFKQHHNFHIKMTQEIVSDLTPAEQTAFSNIIEKVLKKI